MRASPKHLRDLYELLGSVKGAKQAKLLFDDLLTPQERGKLAERWQLVKLLHAGMTQRSIAKKLKISISKVTRGSSALQYGSGGFATFLKKRR